jgi:hypothetical protein
MEINGSEVTIQKTNVGGILSEGMLCDSVMLGWLGGAAGLCVQVPPHFELGSEAPKTKPRMDSTETVPKEVELSAKDLRDIEKVRFIYLNIVSHYNCSSLIIYDCKANKKKRLRGDFSAIWKHFRSDCTVAK